MGAYAARKAAAVLRNSQQVLAIELVVAAQGIEMGESALPLGRGTAAAYRCVRNAVPALGEDRVLAGDFARALELVRSGAVLHAAEGALAV
jgi:histidine ammonia-lyase